jgi:GNAT superfamily N-acetyltransferase
MPRIVPLDASHLSGAAALVAAAAAAARSRQPLLPAGLDDPGRVAALLAGPAGAGLGVAALQGRKVAGFLAPLTFDLWGQPAAYVPEWGQGTADPGLVAGLYASASAGWVGAGRRLHAVTLWVGQPEVEAAWHALGFGRVVVDAVRGLDASSRRPRKVGVRPAGPRDTSTVAALERALRDHLAAAPVCRVHAAPEGRAAVARRLADTAQPIWLAEVAGAAAGFISLQPGDDAPAALRSPGLVRCDGALVLPGLRRRGVGTALLQAALQWASAAGFTGCALDYESANLPAASFWPAAGFIPVLHSVARRLA